MVVGEMKEDPVIQILAERSQIRALLLAVFLGACESIGEPQRVSTRVYQVSGEVVAEQVAEGQGEISFIPDPTGACPADTIQTFSYAPIVTVPIERDGSYSAIVIIDYDAEGPIPQEICTYVRVFMDSMMTMPDSVLGVGPWLLGREPNPPRWELDIEF